MKQGVGLLAGATGTVLIIFDFVVCATDVSFVTDGCGVAFGLAAGLLWLMAAVFFSELLD